MSLQRRLSTLSHALSQWWLRRFGPPAAAGLAPPSRAPLHPLRHWLQSLAHRPDWLQRSPSWRKRPQPPIFFLLTVLLLTSAIGYRLYSEPELGVGVVAPQTLKAPVSATVIDSQSTEENRRAARTAAVPVLMRDPSVNQEILHGLQRLLARGDELRLQAGALPYVDPSILSTPVQRYLRQIGDSEWQQILGRSVSNAPLVEPDDYNGNSDAAAPERMQQASVLELQAYRQTYSPEDFAALQVTIERARQRYAQAVALLNATEADRTFYDNLLFVPTDTEWYSAKIAMRPALDRILTQGIAPGLPETVLQEAIALQLKHQVSPAAAPLSVQILSAVVQPNLIQDPEQTKLRAEQAAQAVKEVVVTIRQGEPIVRAGEPVTPSSFVLLDHFKLSRRRINWAGLLGFAVLVSAAVGVCLIVEWRYQPGLRRRDRLLLLLLALSAPLVLVLELPASNLPAIGLLVGSFYGSAMGVTIVGWLSLLLPIGIEMPWTNFVASSVSALLGAAFAGKLRSREEFALLGIAVGLTQGLVYALLRISTATLPVWYVVLTATAIQCLAGLLWSVFALGISPYLEQLFDLVTPVRLAELSNPNRPLLKRLAAEAPGTFQHTLFVATLAESAACALGCNVELVRAGTLYHDIGKMHDPLGFIENQMGGPNKHDAIDNPWLSADLIKKHVSEGMIMARKFRLPYAVQAFIPEHQGTMLIAYFHHQAQQQAQTDPTIEVKESDFRYPGPTPQSRETGIVMLADSCEAALRSLKDATPEEALAMVNRILRARWQDNQLAQAKISRAEMKKIGEIFVQVWLQFNHQRIAYPKVLLTPAARSANEL